ncbi:MULTISPECIES: YbhB/YbcL family Raf kinase inhibitor-like protein [Subtercola]|uniref:YbhB/YbcL family Raf kinase inhibitor-like protein n=1 Tax=Subtercola vilae TaxID=2056433 RepID=A0A4T2C1X4_9MICO|nr:MULTISPECIES: YbhB/YbcL family Raf kinase inhibitor-like protein [Subtercola]MEA9985698.1 YbhB/YbcL family Raf kinase inhibitor-like protein [Subtercola sp. RTI3]TIH38245.1 YbhB/YbcL family Raf kinase inhibitor-like protein [Subtercola vilae]
MVKLPKPGRLIRRVRAGSYMLAWGTLAPEAPTTIVMSSPDFAEGAAIPALHAGDGAGDNVSPALVWSGLPAGTKQLLLVVEDPDVPLPRPVIHLLARLDPSRTSVARGELNLEAENTGIVLHPGSFNRVGYAGPHPIEAHGPHRYVFQLFALSKPLPLPATARLESVAAAAYGLILARGRTWGTFERP